MRQKLYEYLLARPGGASPRELLDLVFSQPGADPEFGPRFLEVLLGNDARFVRRPADGCWAARVHETLARPLGETDFVILDLETTGLSRSANGIIEIGAARVRGGRVVEEFQRLINPGTWLPRFITQLTGIDDAMLADQPRIAEVWPHFVRFVGNDTIVAHNAAFDVGFLNAACLAYSGQPLSNPHLCTIKLARRLVPELRRRGLDSLAAHFGIPQQDRHRALGDVRITVEIFFHLLERLAMRGIVRLDQALDFQYQARDGRPFVCMLPRRAVEQLPAAPGIYRFFDENGRLLYIGKAKNLRERVASYLSNAAGHSNKTLDLIRHAHDVRVEVGGSELEAALDEAEAIRREQPPYNRLRKHLPRIAYLKLSVADDYPRLSMANRLGAGTARYIGPFRNREQAQRVLGLLTRQFRLRTCPGRLRPDPAASPCFQGQVGACTAPCAAAVSREAYRQQVQDCLQLLDGDPLPAEQALIDRRAAHAAALRFEAAGVVQRDIDLLHMLVRRQRTLGWLTTQQNFLVLQPTPDRRLVLAYAVLSGRLAIRARLNDATEMDELGRQVEELWPRYQRVPIRRDELDGTTILAAWLRDRNAADGCVLRIAEHGPATQLAEWRTACACLLVPAPEQVNALHPDATPPQQERHAGEQPQAGGIAASAN